MPELPEVETTVRILRPELVGSRIERVGVYWPSTIGRVSPRVFARAVEGRSILSLTRRGKHFILRLGAGEAGAGTLVGHLGMSGRLLLRPRAEPTPRWRRLRLALDRERALDFVDPRTFGRLELCPDPDERLRSLGPEPLERTWTARHLHRDLLRRRRCIKPLLLDQSFLAGLGNIYADEALFRARVHPTSVASDLGSAAASRLWRSIRWVLRAAIAAEGTSFDPFYRTPEGRPGGYQPRLNVYGRQGLPCPRCKAPIGRILIAQRSAHFCPRCQPARAAGRRR